MVHKGDDKMLIFLTVWLILLTAYIYYIGGLLIRLTEALRTTINKQREMLEAIKDDQHKLTKKIKQTY